MLPHMGLFRYCSHFCLLFVLQKDLLINKHPPTTPNESHFTSSHQHLVSNLIKQTRVSLCLSITGEYVTFLYVSATYLHTNDTTESNLFEN